MIELLILAVVVTSGVLLVKGKLFSTYEDVKGKFNNLISKNKSKDFTISDVEKGLANIKNRIETLIDGLRDADRTIVESTNSIGKKRVEIGRLEEAIHKMADLLKAKYNGSEVPHEKAKSLIVKTKILNIKKISLDKLEESVTRLMSIKEQLKDELVEAKDQKDLLKTLLQEASINDTILSGKENEIKSALSGSVTSIKDIIDKAELNLHVQEAQMETLNDIDNTINTADDNGEEVKVNIDDILKAA